MKDLNRNNVKERLSDAKYKLEAYTDLKIHFDAIESAEWYTNEYKEAAAALFEAILAKIDPIDY